MNEEIVLLNVRVSMWGIDRKLGDHDYEVDAETSLVRATKKILECPEYEYLLQTKRAMHARLRGLALPAQALRAGVYPIAVPLVEKVDAILRDFEVRWTVGVEQLGEVWDLRIRQIEDRLRGLYDENDYPTWERVQKKFAVSWSYFTASTPTSLQQVSRRLFARERAKAAAEWAEMLADIRGGLRVAFKELIDGLVEKLTPAADGTRKRLVGIDRLLDFVNLFAKQNVANDDELRTLVDVTKSLLAGRTPEELRKDQKLRDLVQERMGSVKAVLDSLIENEPARQILLRD